MKLCNPISFARCGAVCLLCLTSTLAHGALIQHLSAASWSAAAGTPVVTEDVNGFVADTLLVPGPVALAGGMSLQVDPDALSLATGGSFQSLIHATPPVPAGVDGTNHASIRLIEDVQGVATTMRLDFASGATAWGADFALLGGVGGGTFIIEVFAQGGALLGTVDPASLANTAGSGAGFIGFTTTGGDVASHLVFSMQAGGLTNIEAVDMDNLVAVTAGVDVSEPGAAWLAAFALLALLGRREFLRQT